MSTNVDAMQGIDFFSTLPKGMDSIYLEDVFKYTEEQNLLTLEDWILEFDFNREITNIWDAVIVSNENNHYVIRNAGYYSNIGKSLRLR